MAVALSDHHSLPGETPAGADAAPRRGGRGNRLATPPDPYERRKLPEWAWEQRRSRWWREKFLACVREAVRRGVLSPQAARGAGRIADFAGPTGKIAWPSLARIGADEQRAERTAASWTKELREKGWLLDEHQAVNDAGKWKGTSNLYLLVIPEQFEEWWRARRKASRHPTARRPSGRVMPPKTPHQNSPRPAPPLPVEDLERRSADAGELGELPDTPSLAAVRKLVRTRPPRRRRGPP